MLLPACVGRKRHKLLLVLCLDVPAGMWYSLWDDAQAVQGPGPARLPAPLGHVPLHIAGGSIVPMQRPANTTAAVAASPVTLVLALAAPGTLGGSGSSGGVYGQEEWCRRALRGAAAAAPALVGSGGSSLLLACGMLYTDDGEALEVDGPDSLQLLFSSIAAADTRQVSMEQ